MECVCTFKKKSAHAVQVRIILLKIWSSETCEIQRSAARYTLYTMHVSESELKEFIIDSGLVARKDVDAAAEEAKSATSPRRHPRLAGSLTEDALRRIKAYVLGIPFVNLKEIKIEADVLSPYPEPIARTHNIIAFKKTETTRSRSPCST
jgi:hypothetical protein